jgi:hypothetical protein
MFIKRELNTHHDEVFQACNRTKYYVLNHLFSELLNIYLERVKALVHFVNIECNLEVSPDV